VSYVKSNIPNSRRNLTLKMQYTTNSDIPHTMGDIQHALAQRNYINTCNESVNLRKAIPLCQICII